MDWMRGAFGVFGSIELLTYENTESSGKGEHSSE